MYLRDLLEQADRGALLTHPDCMGLVRLEADGCFWIDGCDEALMLDGGVLDNCWQIAEPAPGACTRCKGLGRVAIGFYETPKTNPTLECYRCHGTGEETEMSEWKTPTAFYELYDEGLDIECFYNKCWEPVSKEIDKPMLWVNPKFGSGVRPVQIDDETAELSNWRYKDKDVSEEHIDSLKETVRIMRERLSKTMDLVRPGQSVEIPIDHTHDAEVMEFLKRLSEWKEKSRQCAELYGSMQKT